jgi:hypothetical protein
VQDRKTFTSRLFYQLSPDRLVSTVNFYRILQAALTYNLKKYLRFGRKKVFLKAMSLQERLRYFCGIESCFYSTIIVDISYAENRF